MRKERLRHGSSLENKTPNDVTTSSHECDTIMKKVVDITGGAGKKRNLRDTESRKISRLSDKSDHNDTNEMSLFPDRTNTHHTSTNEQHNHLHITDFVDDEAYNVEVKMNMKLMMT